MFDRVNIMLLKSGVCDRGNDAAAAFRKMPFQSTLYYFVESSLRPSRSQFNSIQFKRNIVNENS